MIIPQPSWLLLLWAGLAATLAAALVGAAPGGVLRARGSPTRRERRRLRRRLGSTVAAMLLGVVIYATIYGYIVEFVGRADLGLGAGVGALHGLLAAGWQLLRRPAHAAGPTPFRLLIGHIVYGAVFGLLYAVPVL